MGVEDRDGSSHPVENAARSPSCAYRIHRDLLQSAKTAFEHRISHTGTGKDGHDDQARGISQEASGPGSRGKVNSSQAISHRSENGRSNGPILRHGGFRPSGPKQRAPPRTRSLEVRHLGGKPRHQVADCFPKPGSGLGKM